MGAKLCGSHRLCMGLYFSSATTTLSLDEPMARSSCMSDARLLGVGRRLMRLHREPLPSLLASRLRLHSWHREPLPSLLTCDQRLHSWHREPLPSLLTCDLRWHREPLPSLLTLRCTESLSRSCSHCGLMSPRPVAEKIKAP